MSNSLDPTAVACKPNEQSGGLRILPPLPHQPSALTGQHRSMVRLHQLGVEIQGGGEEKAGSADLQ